MKVYVRTFVSVETVVPIGIFLCYQSLILQPFFPKVCMQATSDLGLGLLGRV